ncbi:MAG: 4Fe-4S dicluster domain-containing protein [Chloroflexi bacterium]|nr:4Fe-4S dicluster domain-containing protein [Chloroflexota bacterium]
MSHTLWRRARRAVQALALLFSLGLVVYTFRDVRGAWAADDLLLLDPLVGLAAILSGRRWLGAFALGFALLALAGAAGRFWCGWLCPLGTLIDWSAPRPGRRKSGPAAADSRWRAAKYIALFLILAGALWGSLTLIVLDPLTIFVRSIATLILPGLHWLITQLEFLLYRVDWLYGPLDMLDAALRGPFISYKQPIYGGALLLAGLFGGVLALNLFAPRAWCRYLCPLGGFYSLVSRIAWFRRVVTENCVECGRCARECRMGTIDAGQGYASDPGECILCLDCFTDCPTQAIRLRAAPRPIWGKTYDPTRRQALGALGTSLGFLALLRLDRPAHHPADRRLRPPGADEKTLLATCIRCGTCLRTCPSHGLQPSLTEAGLEGLWTPILVPRLGHCDYACTACGEVCPTGAIPRLPLEQKRLIPIGKAYIDQTLCIAWSGRGPCIVCEEMCPLPEKAIYLEERDVPDDQGILRRLQVPIVQHERCIGCGLCENKCPVVGEAAIRVRVDPMG